MLQRCSLLLLFLAITSALSGCALVTEPAAAPTVAPAASGASARANEPVVLTFGASEQERSAYEPLIAQFNADNPDLQVQFVALDEIADQINADAQLQAIARVADTALVDSAAVTQATHPASYLHNLAPLIDADATFDKADFYPAAFTIDRQTGAIYAVAREVGIPLLFYHQDYWTQRGLAPPKPDWTWNDVLAAAEQLAQKRGNTVEMYGLLDDWGSADEILAQVFTTAGIDPLTPLPEGGRLDQPTAVQALQRVAALVTSGAVYLHTPTTAGVVTTSELRELIRAGRVALWSAAMDPDPQVSFSVGTAALPPALLPRFDTTARYVMSRGTQHPEAAWRWLSFVSRQTLGDGPGTGFQTLIRVPARRSIADQQGYWQNLDARTGVAGATVIVRVALEAHVPAAPVDRSVLRALTTALTNTIVNRQSAQQALADAQLALDQQRATAPVATPPPPTPPAFTVATPLPNKDTAHATTITFGFVEGNIEQAVVRRLTRAFQQANPEITVQLKPLDPSEQVIGIAELAAASDCFMAGAFAPSQPLLETLDLQPLIDADPSFDRADYLPNLLALFQRDGRLHALPDQVRFRVLHYNRTAFDARGLSYPRGDWTLDDFLHAAQQLTYEAGGVQYYGYASPGAQVNDLPFFLDRFGAAAVRGTADEPQPNFTDPQVITAARFYVDLLKNYSPHTQIRGYMHQRDDQDILQYVDAGQVGMWLDNSVYRGAMSRPGYTRAIAPPPLGSGAVSPSDIETTGLYIAATTEHPAACWAWLKFLSNDITHVRADWFPARRSLAESDAFQQQAPPGSTEVYAAYQTSLAQRSAAPSPQPRFAVLSSRMDPYWFFQALERALQGADIERELAQAQARTEAYVACYQTTKKWTECAKQVDPTYQGQGLWLDGVLPVN